VTGDAAREAALIEAELLEQGTPINALDMLIAGVVRDAGATLVTRDSDFDSVAGLDVERVR
jgi:tRNA(fMet)-specific endonuclease VapC